MTTNLKSQIIEIYKEDPSLTHTQIGDMLGTSRSTVQRTIAKYNKALEASGEVVEESPQPAFEGLDMFGDLEVNKAEDDASETEEQSVNESNENDFVRRPLNLRPRRRTEGKKPQGIDPSGLSRERLEEEFKRKERKTKAYSAMIKAMSPKREMDRSKNERILLISDLHAPYQHPDALDFLNALEERYEFDCVICMGDELDNNYKFSFDDKPESLLPKDEEISEAKKFIGYLEQVFPEMDLVDGNHNRIRDELFATYENWLFIDEVDGEFKPKTDYYGRMRGLGWKAVGHNNKYQLPDGTDLYVCHDISWSADNLKDERRSRNAHIAQGHHHAMFGIDWINEDGIPPFACVSTGCLIKPDAPAFEYGNKYKGKPVIGCAGFLDSEPVMFRMKLNEFGRWTGKL